MKKRHSVFAQIVVISTIISAYITFFSFTLASDVVSEEANEIEIELPDLEERESNNPDSSTKNFTKKEKDEETKKLDGASKTIINNQTKKDKRIAELTDKYNDSVYGHVAYYLEVAQKYSLPICFIGLTIGSFNFLIIGNKKLDKKEQGFGWIVGFTIGLVVFNVIPLIFALFVAGR